MAAALKYSLTLETALRRYATDGCLEIDNNTTTEQSVPSVRPPSAGFARPSRIRKPATLRAASPIIRTSPRYAVSNSGGSLSVYGVVRACPNRSLKAT